MNDAAKRPVHLWVVAILSTLWNAFGCFDYVMTQTRNPQYLSGFSEEARAYFASFPPLMDAAWAFGVWGAFAGSLLLLARSRHAVLAFGLSLLGLLAATIYQFAIADAPAELQSGAMLAMNLFIWAVCIALFIYARRMSAKGVLR